MFYTEDDYPNYWTEDISKAYRFNELGSIGTKKRKMKTYKIDPFKDSKILEVVTIFDI
jgi:hypothetical protein